MLNFLRKNQQFFILFIILYGIVSVLGVYSTQPYQRYTQLPFRMPMLMDIFNQALSSKRMYLLFSLSQLLILVVSSFYLVNIGIKNLIITRRSQFSALFYLAIVSFALPSDFLNGAGIASLFMLFAVDRMIGSIHIKGRTYRFFDAGLLIGLGSLFYFNLLFVFPFIWVAQYLLRPLSWREFTYSLIGLLFPFIYLLSLAFIFDQPLADTWNYIEDWMMLDKVFLAEWPSLIGLGIYMLSLIIGSLFALKKFGTTKINARKLYQLFFFLFVNHMLIFIVIPSAGIEILYLAAVPASILFSIYFTDCRPNFLNRLFFLLLLIVPVLNSILVLL
jgi:hypothetical protein